MDIPSCVLELSAVFLYHASLKNLGFPINLKLFMFVNSRVGVIKHAKREKYYRRLYTGSKNPDTRFIDNQIRSGEKKLFENSELINDST